MAGSVRCRQSHGMEQGDVSAVHWSVVPVEVDAMTLLFALIEAGSDAGLSGGTALLLAQHGPVSAGAKVLALLPGEVLDVGAEFGRDA